MTLFTTVHPLSPNQDETAPKIGTVRRAQYRTMVTTALLVMPYIGPVSAYLREGLKARGSIVQRAIMERQTDMPANAAAVQKI